MLRALIWLAIVATPAIAADKAQLHTTAEEGFGRLVLEFPGRLDLPGVRREAGPSALTPREVEVLRLVAAGLTNRQVGAQLFMSEKTASVHVSRILAKLGASGRAEAAARAAQLGLL